MCVHISSCGSFTGCVFDVDVSVSSEVTHPTASLLQCHWCMDVNDAGVGSLTWLACGARCLLLSNVLWCMSLAVQLL